MDTTQLPPDFKDFLKLLTDHQFEYLLIGGYSPQSGDSSVRLLSPLRS
jgi:hypothetical protein